MTNNKLSVKKVYYLFEATELFVLDFSALMFTKDDRLLNWLAKSVTSGSKKVVVSKEFYRCYSIVASSENERQREIAKKSHLFLLNLKEKKALISDSKFSTTEDLIEGLRNNPKVTILLSEHSEAAEKICSYDDAKINVFAVNHEGKFYCASASEFKAKRITTVNSNDDNSKILKLKSVPSEGALLRTADGTEITLGKQISKGAEGTVYLTDNEKLVCKVYHNNQMTVQRCRKLKLFENRPVDYEGICWPEKIVYNPDGLPVGYIMKKALGKTMSSVFDGDESVLSYFPNIKRSDLIGIAIDILEKIQYLHLLGIVVGDIRPQNIIIDKVGSVYLIDMDSCQINDFPCPFGDEDYTPPENQKKVFSSFLRTYDNEKFSCAVIAFVTLFLGLHPYSQKNGAETMAEEIEMRTFPYPENNAENAPRVPDGGYDLIWKHLPIPMSKMFFDVFKTGKRPTLISLILLLDSYKKYLEENCNSSDPLQLVSYYGYSDENATVNNPEPDETDAYVSQSTEATNPKAKNSSKAGKVAFAFVGILTAFLLLLYILVYVFILLKSGPAPFWQPIVNIYEYFSDLFLGGV